MLESTWFILWGILWAVYFMLDGFDLGLGSLMPVLAKNEEDKKIIFNSMGPFWDGNEVWLISAGGVTFAAFPTTYAVMFSSLYTPLMLILFALILRGVSFEFRSKINNLKWKSIWDLCLIIGSFLPALLFGVAFANIFKGLPIDGEGLLHGNILTLLNPYGLVGGLLFVLLFLVHGALWLIIRSDGDLQERAISLVPKLWIILLIISVAFLVATWFYTPLYNNYLTDPILFIIPIITVISLLNTRYHISKDAWLKAWTASCFTIFTAVMFGVIGLYPNMFPSTIDPSYSLNIHNSSSSPLTLKIMLIVALIVIPIVIAYQTWVYFLFKGKTKDNEMIY